MMAPALVLVDKLQYFDVPRLECVAQCHGLAALAIPGQHEGSRALRSALAKIGRGVDQEPAHTLAAQARDAWVPGATPASPARARRQASAFEFHWGKPPPPAAAPRTTALIAAVLLYPTDLKPRRLQVGAGVGVDFHADGDLDDTRCFPSHGVSPLRCSRDDEWNSKNVSSIPPFYPTSTR